MLVFPHFVRALLQLRTYLSCLFVHFVVVVVFYFFFSPFFFFSLMSLCVVWKPQPETNPFLKEILLTVLQTCVL